MQGIIVHFVLWRRKDDKAVAQRWPCKGEGKHLMSLAAHQIFNMRKVCFHWTIADRSALQADLLVNNKVNLRPEQNI